MKVNICPKESTPYFAMGLKCQQRHVDFAKWLQQQNITMEYDKTDVVEFTREEDFTIFFLTWPHSYTVVE